MLQLFTSQKWCSLWELVVCFLVKYVFVQGWTDLDCLNVLFKIQVGNTVSKRGDFLCQKCFLCDKDVPFGEVAPCHASVTLLFFEVYHFYEDTIIQDLPVAK